MPMAASRMLALMAIDRGDHLWFDTPTFIGKSWETADGVVLLNLQRKDEPGAHFVEVIIMGDRAGLTVPEPGIGSRTGNCTGVRCATKSGSAKALGSIKAHFIGEPPRGMQAF